MKRSLLRALNYSLLPIITVLTIVGLLFAQPGGTYTAYTGDDAEYYALALNGFTTRWVGNSAICVNPMAGRYIGDSVKLTCACDNGCEIQLSATAGTPAGGDLHQSVDGYVPYSGQIYWQSWMHLHEDCVDLSYGIPYGEIIEDDGSGTCGAPL